MVFFISFVLLNFRILKIIHIHISGEFTNKQQTHNAAGKHWKSELRIVILKTLVLQNAVKLFGCKVIPCAV